MENNKRQPQGIAPTFPDITRRGNPLWLPSEDLRLPFNGPCLKILYLSAIHVD